MLPLTLILAGLFAPHPYPQPVVNAWGVNPGVRRVSIRVEQGPRTAVPTAAVSFTTEPFAVSSSGPLTTLKERDVLGSGLQMDLNGDGKISGSIPLNCENGALKIGTQTVRPVGSKYTADSSARLTAKGASIVLYGPCDGPTMVGLSPKPIAVETMAGPLLQVNVIETGVGLKDTAKLLVGNWTLDGKPIFRIRRALIHSYERLGDKPEWFVVHWAMIPVPAKGSHTVGFKIEGQGAGQVFSTVNIAAQPGERLRGPMAGRPLPQ